MEETKEGVAPIDGVGLAFGLFLAGLMIALLAVTFVKAYNIVALHKSNEEKIIINDGLRKDILISSCDLIGEPKKIKSCVAAVEAGDYRNAYISLACEAAVKRAGPDFGMECLKAKINARLP